MPKMTINKKYLQNKILDKEDIKPELAFYMVRDFFEIISEALEQGEEVKLIGFGRFRLLKKKARPGRDILKSSSVEISARTVVSFAPSKLFVQAVNKSHKARL